ncbi:hypothetical protein RHMOL_Rhmol01G0148800 [Rhododendron molle]|uniref:Uncharacterized protein n=1 Tax=Rhododendron molle TaxID=49168 RepID=A0ACC0Q3I4_RHOML|nr:hypothetical protein RHMOL_Rhmol01G0148800 [Rhododendron molle]
MPHLDGQGSLELAKDECIPTKAGPKSKNPDRYYYKCSRGIVSLFILSFVNFACTINYVTNSHLLCCDCSARNGKVGATGV